MGDMRSSMRILHAFHIFHFFLAKEHLSPLIWAIAFHLGQLLLIFGLWPLFWLISHFEGCFGYFLPKMIINGLSGTSDFTNFLNV